MTGRLPDSASVTTPGEAGKLHAPAAARNVAAITDLLRHHAPVTGRALEIASGTGQHVVSFARALPGLHWQPTDLDPERLASIDAHAAEAGRANLAPARRLDATQAGWGKVEGPFDLILLINLLHLISRAEAERILQETALALAPGGRAIFYGPFKRDGALTSPGDKTFDAQLRAADPAIGYKDRLDMLGWLGDAGLVTSTEVEMPANNLAFIAQAPK